jgi:ABC-2 type transport system permease protein
MSADSPIISGVEQVNMTWASPVNVDSESLSDDLDRNTVTRLSSPDRSWLSNSTDVMPRVSADGSDISPWSAGDETGSYPLAVASTGQFSSYFAGKPSPLVSDSSDAVQNEHPLAAIDSVNDAATDATDTEPVLSESIDHVIERSPESARLIGAGHRKQNFLENYEALLSQLWFILTRICLHNGVVFALY